MTHRKQSAITIRCSCGEVYQITGHFKHRASKYARLRVYYALCPKCHRPQNPWKEEERCGGCNIPARLFDKVNFFKATRRCRFCAEKQRGRKPIVRE